jgi:hypothetical protein
MRIKRSIARSAAERARHMTEKAASKKLTGSNRPVTTDAAASKKIKSPEPAPDAAAVINPYRRMLDKLDAERRR